VTGSVSQVLVVAAVEAELIPLGRGPWATRVLGIGAVDAALSIATYAPGRLSAIWLLGTAGAYPGTGLQPGDLVIGTRHHLRLGMGHGHSPAAQPSLAAPPLPAAAASCQLPRVSTVTTGAVTTSTVDAERLAALGQVEHLEAFSVARWAQQQPIPFAALLAISNQVGPSAHAEWLRWRTRAEETACATLRRILAGNG
jgi:purine-nucleoside phosphorylase